VKEAKPEPRKVAATPAEAPAGAAGDEIRQVRESVAEDFRRMGEAGAPIPKNWLRALNSDKVDVRDSAQSAITSYYQAFLRRYEIGEESVNRVTESIIRMMRREGEFAAMSEEEAQHHLQNMLVDAGASFQGAAAGGASTRRESGTADGGGEHKDAEKEVRRGEKKRFRLETRGSRRAGKTKGRDYGQLTGEEDSIDWE
jgi:hypothetical protein